MWESVGEALKVFVEKHLVPTVISVVAAIIVLLILPSDYWMIEKIGKHLFFLGAAGVVFLAIQFLIVLEKGIGHLRFKSFIRNENQKYRKQEADENLEAWLSFVDRLPPEDRELILQFIQTENKPIRERGYRTYNDESLHSTEYIIKMKNSDGSKLVRLDDRFYKLMKAIYENRGSISHFD